MERKVGTISRGIRCPIIREGDNLAEIVVDSVLDAAESEGFEIRDRDVISVTESVVARAQGNYASIDAIAGDVKAKLGGETIGVIFPILSRNRFSICLKGIAKGAKKVVLMLSYPSDEVGNSLVSLDQVDEAGINPYSDVLDLKRYIYSFYHRQLFLYPVFDEKILYAEGSLRGRIRLSVILWLVLQVLFDGHTRRMLKGFLK